MKVISNVLNNLLDKDAKGGTLKGIVRFTGDPTYYKVFHMNKECKFIPYIGYEDSLDTNKFYYKEIIKDKSLKNRLEHDNNIIIFRKCKIDPLKAKTKEKFLGLHILDKFIL